MPAPMSRASGCGAASLGVLLGLDDHERTGLAEHEAVAVLVERTRSALGVVVAGRHGTHHRERRDGQRLDAALDTTADGDVGVAHDDLPPRVRDGLRARRTGRHRGHDAGAGAELQADDGSGAVRHDHLNGERRHLAGAALVHQVIGLDDLLAAAQTGADDDREAVPVDLGCTRGLPDLAAEQLGHPLDIRHAPQIQPSHVVVDGLLEVATDVHGQVPLGDELVLEDADAAFAGQQALPRALDVRRDRCRRRDGGHHNAGETAVSSGRPGHVRSASIFSRSAAAASGFSSSSFWM